MFRLFLFHYFHGGRSDGFPSWNLTGRHVPTPSQSSSSLLEGVVMFCPSLPAPGPHLGIPLPRALGLAVTGSAGSSWSTRPSSLSSRDSVIASGLQAGCERTPIPGAAQVPLPSGLCSAGPGEDRGGASVRRGQPLWALGIVRSIPSPRCPSLGLCCAWWLG